MTQTGRRESPLAHVQREGRRYLLPCSFTLTLTAGLAEACAEAREREESVRQLLEPLDERMLLRLLTAEGVTPVLDLACDTGVPTEEFWSRCLALRGVPWSEARMRRDMRERVRIWRHVRERAAWLPVRRDELIALWSEANEGEYPLYREATTARFRMEGTPFAHGGIPFESAPLPTGADTSAPEEIPGEVDRLLSLIADAALPLEVRSAAAHFAHAVIHPFRDGNGHCARMLSASLLAQSYSLPTLLALVTQLQERRHEVSVQIKATVRERADAECVCRCFLDLLAKGQQDVLARWR